MNSFVNAVKTQDARTENGMKALRSTSNPLTDLFFKIGASRGKNIIPDWTAAKVADPLLAGRIALWVRDIRNGAGERKLFRDIIADLVTSDTDRAVAMLQRVPELGRWDDLLIPEVLTNEPAREVAFSMIKTALESGAEAKRILQKIDSMSESECQKILDSYNDQNDVAS